MPGMIGTVNAGDWWYSFHLFIWDTGERTGATLAARWEHFDSVECAIEIPGELRKGGKKTMCYRIKPGTVAAIQAIAHNEKRIWHWPQSLATFYHAYARLLVAAGLPSDSKSKPQRMRRSFASHLEAAGGNATEALGHSARRVTRESYLDPRICEGDPPNRKLFDVG